MADLSDKILQLDRSQEETQTEERAARLGLAYTNLSGQHLDIDVLKLIPRDRIESLQCIPLELKEGILAVGVVEPESDGVKQGLREIEQMTGYTIKPVLISASSFTYGHKTYDISVRENEGERPVVLTEKNMDQLTTLVDELKKGQEISGLNVTDLFSALLAVGVQKLASDVHFEPMEKQYMIRLRIDGVLHELLERPQHEYAGLISRIKYLAKMPLGATTHPQDGRFTITVADTALDLRVSSLPTIYGEMMTVRILNKETVMLHLEQLGLRKDLEQIVRASFTKPHGMVLVTGPTGSGKTTTLYSILAELNKEERKIITIEDPVEYKIAGLEQSQVDPERGYDFVDALRGALRQDPDVLMIGEIRDKETANIGIRAALTGHIVLATMHANNAPSAYSRLLEMEIQPFLFSGSINMIMAQRLLRLLCEQCKKAHQITTQEVALFQRELGRVPEQVFEAVGCAQCGNIGYRGRTAIFEAFVPSPAMEQMAILHSSLTAFAEQAHKEGLITMMQDGLLKVEQGLTSISEVMRVTRD